MPMTFFGGVENTISPCPPATIATVATVQEKHVVEKSISVADSCDSCDNPLHHLNTHDIAVDISRNRGLILTAGFAMTESLRAHFTLWTLARWDSLLAALGWEGQELPRRVEVRSLSRYQLPRRAA